MTKISIKGITNETRIKLLKDKGDIRLANIRAKKLVQKLDYAIVSLVMARDEIKQLLKLQEKHEKFIATLMRF